MVGACAFATVALETTAERGREEEEQMGRRDEGVRQRGALERIDRSIARERKTSTTPRAIDRAGKRTSLARLDLAGHGL